MPQKRFQVVNISRYIHESGIHNLCMHKSEILGKFRAFKGDYVRVVAPKYEQIRGK